MKVAKVPLGADKCVAQEMRASRHINIVGHYDDHTLIDSDGKLIRLFKVAGIPYQFQSALALDSFKQRRHAVFKQFDVNLALYCWTVRSLYPVSLSGTFDALYANTLHQQYQTQLQRRSLFRNEFYIALVSKPPTTKLQKTMGWLARFTHHFQRNAQAEDLKEKQATLTVACQMLMSAFADYGIKPLSITKSKDQHFSESLAFIAQLINGKSQSVPLLPEDIRWYLPQLRLFFNTKTGTIHFRNATGQWRYAAILSIKAYNTSTYAGIFDALHALPMEFVLTQSYRFLDRPNAKTKLKHQQKDFIQAQDEATTQIAEITSSLDETASGEIGQGIHHLSLLCFAEDMPTLNQHVADICSAFADIDMHCVREDIACELAFWAQLPGNFAYISREALISTKNLAGFISLHNEPLGSKSGNYWGEAVTVIETIAGSPYYFNFHYRDVGNTLIFGAMGGGKTLLQGFLLAQSLKFGGKRIVFDKDRGLEILIRALGGHYEILTPGVATGLNPCQLDDTPENRDFLASLLKILLTLNNDRWDETDAALITTVIDGLYRLPRSDRCFRHIAPFFGTKRRGSLRARFDEWHSEGSYAWLFDNVDDTLLLQKAVCGFELGALLKDKACGMPALFYLMYRANQQLHGKRGAIFIDEGWQALTHPYFQHVINELGRTPRKKNQFLCVATHVVEDVVASPFSKALVDSSMCKIFFPNPAASREIYIDKLGLSEQEFHWISQKLPHDGHYFLLTYGQGKESVVGRLNLQGLDDAVAVISGRTQTVQLVDTLRAEVGENPSVWLPLFHQRRKAL